MATTLGKRKRRGIEATKEDWSESVEESSSLQEHAQAIFRRHFEAKFKPLPVGKKVITSVDETSEDDYEAASDWDGISEDGESNIQIIEHIDAQSRMGAMSKEKLKLFMGSKPPKRAPDTPLIWDKGRASVADDDSSEAANLKKDLALQRLLAESHLLDSATNPTLSGKNRHKATDLRIQALGSKASILKQEKMPMSHRKGIIAKQIQREEARRKEAKENGIILEKANNGPNNGSGTKKRDRGVGAPGVGTFSGGTLKLSKKDIFDIEGPRKSFGVRGGISGEKRGRGRGKGGR